MPSRMYHSLQTFHFNLIGDKTYDTEAKKLINLSSSSGILGALPLA